jgi:hypothetical protein
MSGSLLTLASGLAMRVTAHVGRRAIPVSWKIATTAGIVYSVSIPGVEIPAYCITFVSRRAEAISAIH